MHTFLPRYIQARNQGLLAKKIQKAASLLTACTLCPRQCGVDRTKNEKGVCATGKNAVVSSFMPHFGEEPQLSGNRGSGTLFFSHCNLGCVFCQNYEISIEGQGEIATDEQIAAIMLYLQEKGCHNINLVTPSHVVPQILRGLDIAAKQGLTLPLVYNCSGYERVETLKILEDIVDIYMPDFKFWDPEIARRYCNAKDYPDIARAAVKEMHRQVGELQTDNAGIAVSGLLVRHLVLPRHLAGTRHVLAFLKNEVFPRTHVNIMSQYRPMGDAARWKELSRPVTPEEFQSAVRMGRDLGLNLI